VAAARNAAVTDRKRKENLPTLIALNTAVSSAEYNCIEETQLI